MNSDIESNRILAPRNQVNLYGYKELTIFILLFLKKANKLKIKKYYNYVM